MKPTVAEEIAAILELASRTHVHHSPGAPALMEAYHPGSTVISDLGSTEVPANGSLVCVCRLVRLDGPLRLPGTATGRCAGCREEILFTLDDTAARATKLCAMCALRHRRANA